MTQHNIVFATTNVTNIQSAPWASPARTTYQDLLLKPGFAERKFRFPAGQTWFRILPAFAESANWMQMIKVLNHGGGRHAHPKSVDPKSTSVFDLAYQWLKVNQPSRLFNKSNRDGFRLLADPHCVCWILVEIEGTVQARLVLASAYDASRGGVAGLGCQLWTLITDSQREGGEGSDPLAPEAGLQVCVERNQPAGTRYPSYRLRLGRQPAPVTEILSRMDAAEVAAIRPLEQLIHVPEQEEEWKLLETVVDPETVAKIRAAQA